MPTIVNWVRAGKDPKAPANIRSQRFDTKRQALEMINRADVAVISRLANDGGRTYCVQLKSG